MGVLGYLVQFGEDVTLQEDCCFAMYHAWYHAPSREFNKIYIPFQGFTEVFLEVFL